MRLTNEATVYGSKRRKTAPGFETESGDRLPVIV
jgi:hypothetical protein